MALSIRILCCIAASFAVVIQADTYYEEQMYYDEPMYYSSDSTTSSPVVTTGAPADITTGAPADETTGAPVDPTTGAPAETTMKVDATTESVQQELDVTTEDYSTAPRFLPHFAVAFASLVLAMKMM